MEEGNKGEKEGTRTKDSSEGAKEETIERKEGLEKDIEKISEEEDLEETEEEKTTLPKEEIDYTVNTVKEKKSQYDSDTYMQNEENEEPAEGELGSVLSEEQLAHKAEKKYLEVGEMVLTKEGYEKDLDPRGSFRNKLTEELKKRQQEEERKSNEDFQEKIYGKKKKERA